MCFHQIKKKYQYEGTPPLERSGTATRGGLAEDGRAVTTLLRIDGSPGDLHGPGRRTGYTGTGTVRPPPTGSRGRVGREVEIVDEIRL